MSNNRSDSPIRIRNFVRQNSHPYSRDPERPDSVIEKVMELRDELDKKNQILEDKYNQIFNLSAEISGTNKELKCLNLLTGGTVEIKRCLIDNRNLFKSRYERICYMLDSLEDDEILDINRNLDHPINLFSLGALKKNIKLAINQHMEIRSINNKRELVQKEYERAITTTIESEVE